MREHARWDRELVQSLSRARLPSLRQIRHLPEVLSSNDSLRLKLGAGLFAIGLVILGASLYQSNTVIVPAVGGTIIEGVVGTPRSLNPILSAANDVDADLTRLAYSSLFAVDADGRIAPDLVERYSVSDDRLAYSLVLREGVEWHDGRPLTAEDVAFTISLIQDPAWKSPLQPVLKDVRVETRGERDVVLILDKPFAPLLSKLRFGILPKHVWKDIAPQNALMAEQNLKPVGSGPYRFKSLKRDKRGFVLSYTLERNPSYFREPAYVEEIVFMFYPDHASAVEALRKRQVDSLSFVPRDLRADVRGMAHVLPVSLKMPQYAAVFFNQERNPALKEKAVRKALLMSVDKSRILLDVLGGEGHPLDGPPIFGYSEILKTAPAYDPAHAMNLLQEAGWAAGEDGARAKGDMTLSLTITTVDQPENLAAMRLIRDGWESIGVDVTIQAVPPGELYRTVIRPRSYEALLFGQLLEADPDPYPFWHSSQTADPGLNLALFRNAAADQAIEAARKAGDPEERKAHYRRFLEILADETPAVFLYSPSYSYPIPEGLKGFSGTRLSEPSDRFASVTGWYLETKRAWRRK